MAYDAYLALVNSLVQEGILKTPRIIKAFRVVHRKYFLPEALVDRAGFDQALPIGSGQTNSQPYTVAFMLELLAPKPGQNVLDIGYGSGWTSALLGHIVGPKGRVYAFEIVKEICSFGETNIEKFKFISRGIVKTLCKSALEGAPEFAPYDRILVSASASSLRQSWINQLTASGRLVAPVSQSIWLIEKQKAGVRRTEYPGFSFVPLI